MISYLKLYQKNKEELATVPAYAGITDKHRKNPESQTAEKPESKKINREWTRIYANENKEELATDFHR